MKRFGSLLLAGLMLTGCVRTHTTDLAMPPPEVRLQVAGAQNIGVKVSVSDARWDKTNIGFGYSAADRRNKTPVVSNQPVELVVAQGIEAELKARGFQVAEGPAFLLVDVTVLESGATWHLFRTDVEGRTGISAQVLDMGGRKLYARPYHRSENTSNQVAMGNWDEGKVQLEKVLAATVRDMFEDDSLIQALIDANRRR